MRLRPKVHTVFTIFKSLIWTSLILGDKGQTTILISIMTGVVDPRRVGEACIHYELVPAATTGREPFTCGAEVSQWKRAEPVEDTTALVRIV